MSFYNVEVKKKRGKKVGFLFVSLKWTKTKQYNTNPHLLVEEEW